MRNKFLRVACLAFGLYSTLSAAQPPETDPGDLPEFFAGTWTLKGREQFFSEKCDWLSPNSYLVCEGKDSDPTEPAKWLTLMGYSHATETYNFSAFDGNGAKIEFSGWLRGDIWNFVAHKVIGKEVIRIQVTITPTKQGYMLREESSVNGAPWKVTNEEEHLRVE